MRALYLVVLVGCTGNAPVISDAKPDAPASYMQTLPDGPCAVESVTGDVSGITIAIRSDSCVFHRGTGGHFTYEVTATANAAAITVPDSGGGCSRCDAYTSDPISFTSFHILGTSAGGEDQHYCLCDTGCCPPTGELTIQLDVTTSTKSFDWSGRTWTGPSDTPTEMGDFFLPGRYNVTVGFAGFAGGSTSAALPIEVVD
jgi:hypothetical protein